MQLILLLRLGLVEFGVHIHQDRVLCLPASVAFLFFYFENGRENPLLDFCLILSSNLLRLCSL